MATNKNINECGWFYHAPGKKSNEPTEPVETPYISQIPGLSEIPDEEYSTTPQELYYKDTDTKFIRLSKQGGRKDLLVFKDRRTESEEPQGYPRVDWFYLQDNAQEDAKKEEPKEQWKFLLPEYMVHESYVPSFGEDNSPENIGPGMRSRVPYACDKQTIFETEGKAANDKRVRIPEAKHSGFGVRNSKPVTVKSHAGKPTAPESTYGRKPQVDNTAQMHQILSYDYEKQWQEQRQKSNSKFSPSKPKGEPPIPSEYDDKYGKTITSTKKSHRPSPSPTSRRADGDHVLNHTELQDKELFKLTKFKNVPARINSHQPILQPN